MNFVTTVPGESDSPAGRNRSHVALLLELFCRRRLD